MLETDSNNSILEMIREFFTDDKVATPFFQVEDLEVNGLINGSINADTEFRLGKKNFTAGNLRTLTNPTNADYIMESIMRLQALDARRKALIE